ETESTAHRFVLRRSLAQPPGRARRKTAALGTAHRIRRFARRKKLRRHTPPRSRIWDTASDRSGSSHIDEAPSNHEEWESQSQFPAQFSARDAPRKYACAIPRSLARFRRSGPNVLPTRGARLQTALVSGEHGWRWSCCSAASDKESAECDERDRFAQSAEAKDRNPARHRILTGNRPVA